MEVLARYRPGCLLLHETVYIAVCLKEADSDLKGSQDGARSIRISENISKTLTPNPACAAPYRRGGETSRQQTVGVEWIRVSHCFSCVFGRDLP